MGAPEGNNIMKADRQAYRYPRLADLSQHVRNLATARSSLCIAVLNNVIYILDENSSLRYDGVFISGNEFRNLHPNAIFKFNIKPYIFENKVCLNVDGTGYILPHSFAKVIHIENWPFADIENKIYPVDAPMLEAT